MLKDPSRKHQQKTHFQPQGFPTATDINAGCIWFAVGTGKPSHYRSLDPHEPLSHPVSKNLTELTLPDIPSFTYSLWYYRPKRSMHYELRNLSKLLSHLMRSQFQTHMTNGMPIWVPDIIISFTWHWAQLFFDTAIKYIIHIYIIYIIVIYCIYGNCIYIYIFII